MGLLSEDAIVAIVDIIAQALNNIIEQVQHKILWADIGSSIKTLAILELCRRIAPWISITFMFSVGVNLIFCRPLLEASKDGFMAKYGTHIEKMFELKDNLLARVPRYTGMEDKED